MLISILDAYQELKNPKQNKESENGSLTPEQRKEAIKKKYEEKMKQRGANG